MRRAPGLRVLPLVLGLLAALGTVACTRAVAGAPAVAPPHAFPVTAPAAPGSAAGPGATAGPGAPTSAAAESGRLPPAAGARSGEPRTTAGAAAVGLEPDVLADECLLDARRLAALLGRPVGQPEQSVVRRDDGSRSSSCYARPAEGAPAPLAAVNVYRVRAGTPTQVVRAAAAGGRALARAGGAATVLETAGGTTLQVAGARYLVTIAVQGRKPDDAAWRAAARHALSRLPR